jgi:isoleucyl-tRNA synthetase
MNDMPKAAAEPDYSATLFLPETSFPMRAGLPDREPVWLKRWEDMRLYELQRTRQQGKPLFTLHDGPPYANGNIHIGHALNKILKDLVTRSKNMLGYNSAYVPGWDCHGLPIEWKIEEQYRAKGQDKSAVGINEFRAECRTFAQYWVDTQREEFKRLGVIGDWGNPYLTMSFDAEAQIARELHKIAESGQLYRGSKPVMWSVVERTALAEAEIEYQDYESDAIWVKFPVVGRSLDGNIVPVGEALAGASVVIWTTTPWTIPANRAISFSDHILYGAYKVTKAPADNWLKEGEVVIVASAIEGRANNLVDQMMKQAKVEVFEPYLFDGRTNLIRGFDGLVCAHPLRGLGGGYEFNVPFLDGEHVTDDVGTGFVHTAPGHGLDDFGIWMDSGRKIAALGIDTTIPYVVDDAGYYTDAAPGFDGARVIDDAGKKGDANQRVINALAERGMMVARGRLKHQYPHSWRSKKPVIFRNTPQWFVYMDRDIGGKAGDTLRARSLAAIDATTFYPAAGQNRIRAMIADRPDWVLSRQRAWGVPIAVFYNEATNTILSDETVNHRIGQAFEEEGADAWFKPGAKERFLGNAVPDPENWTKIDDILDVWFESGTTHSWVLRNPQKWPDLQFPAGMYLEGSDQHRGWFHSSLLESCATNGYAPYASVLTHGFTLDGEGKKMSKSMGNTTAPQDVIKQFGADILRLWVAQSDYADDLRIGKDIINTTVDSYRKLRNTMRWLLGNLAHYKADEAVVYADMPELERLILNRLVELDALVREAYEEYDYKRIVAALSNFMNVELSAFYFDIRKDALYCDPISSVRRKACLTVLDSVFDCLTAWLAPILVFTMEECWLERHSGETESVHLREMPAVPSAWADAGLAAKWEDVKTVRGYITRELEIARREKLIGSSLEAAPKVTINDPQLWEAASAVDLAEVAITSGLTLVRGEAADGEPVAVEFARATGTRCARSWKYTDDVGSDPDYPDLSARDAQAMRERAAAGL